MKYTKQRLRLIISLLENEEESPIISSRIGSAVWENDQELRPLNAQQNEKLSDALR